MIMILKKKIMKLRYKIKLEIRGNIFTFYNIYIFTEKTVSSAAASCLKVDILVLA